MTEEMLSELRKLLDANQYEEVINFCNQKLAISDSENFDNFTLAKIYLAKGCAEYDLGNMSEAKKG